MTQETQDRITALRNNVLDSIPKDQRTLARTFGAALAILFQTAYHHGLELKHQAAILRTFAAQTDLEAGDMLTVEQQQNLDSTPVPAYVPAAA